MPKKLASAAPELPPKIRRALELVYGVEGVVAAQVWHLPGRIAVGVRAGGATLSSSLLWQVESAVAGLREPGETWDFGILESVLEAVNSESAPTDKAARLISPR
ncbi:MAG TPA: hypothetical protein VN894_20690 [Polyangiaceae bacterium]|nr:hypothetical protein [Polyangiaceae bacterium]